jgi:hypothetical protein
MGLFDWLKRKENTKDSGASDVQFDRGEEMFAGLNMKEAIEAHLAWRKRLEAAVADKTIGNYEIHVVASDCNCVLGKWLQKEAKAYSCLPEYDALRLAHAEFHLMAGDILAQIRDGSYEAASSRIKTDLRRHSDQVQLNLIRLCTKANYANKSDTK